MEKRRFVIVRDADGNDHAEQYTVQVFDNMQDALEYHGEYNVLRKLNREQEQHTRNTARQLAKMVQREREVQSDNEIWDLSKLADVHAPRTKNRV